MKKTITSLTIVALLALAGPAGAAGPVPFKGKTSSGHTVTFGIKKNRIHDFIAGIRMSCISIQGGGAPLGGAEVFGFRGSQRISPHLTYSFLEKPAFHYKEVTTKGDLWLKRRGRTVTGRMRLQYSFLIPKYPIGTFTIYSCLGGGTFKAKARR